MHLQVLPKGGWWRRTLSEVNEQHVRIMIAAVGLGYDRILSSSEVAEEVLTGKMPAAVYARLAAVAASIFSSMAMRERGANGRARRAVLEEVELADFAANGLRPPRYLVAQLASRVISQNMDRRLCQLERARVQLGSPAAVALSKAIGPSGERLLLVYADKLGLAWLDPSMLSTSEAGRRCVEQHDSLLLPSFGFTDVLLQDSTNAALPTPLVQMAGCTSCGQTRSVAQFRSQGSKSSVLLCYLCRDVGNGDNMYRPCVECGNVLFKAAFSQKQWQRHGNLASRCKQCVAGSPHSARPKTCTEASGCNCSLDPCILVRQQMHTAGRLLPLDSLNVEGGERMPFAIVLPVKEVRYTSTCAPYV